MRLRGSFSGLLFVEKQNKNTGMQTARTQSNAANTQQHSCCLCRGAEFCGSRSQIVIAMVCLRYVSQMHSGSVEKAGQRAAKTKGDHSHTPSEFDVSLRLLLFVPSTTIFRWRFSERYACTISHHHVGEVRSFQNFSASSNHLVGHCKVFYCCALSFGSR